MPESKQVFTFNWIEHRALTMDNCVFIRYSKLKVLRNVVGSVVFISFYVLLMKIQPTKTQEVMETTVGTEMRRLRGDLMKNYNKDERPLKNQSLPVAVLLYFDVKHIINLDEKFQILSVKGELMMVCMLSVLKQFKYILLLSLTGKNLQKWKDEHLTWDASSYSGISRIRLRSEDIWVPNIYSIYNVKEADIYNKAHNGAALVLSNGSVNWYPEATFHVPCNTRFRHYPFDSHNCSILLNAWSKQDTITLETIELPMSWSPSSVEGSTWTMTKVEHESLDPKVYYGSSTVLVRLFLERTSRMYRYICIVPTIVALASSIFGFWLLPSDTSRYMIGCTNVILMSLSLQNMAATVPSGKDVPLIALYSATFLCLSGAFILVTAISDLLRQSSGRPPQAIIQFSRHYLDRHLCLNLFSQSSNGDRVLGELTAATPEGTLVVSPEEDKRRKDWEYISLVVDRISFFGFIVLYGILLGVLASV